MASASARRRAIGVVRSERRQFRIGDRRVARLIEQLIGVATRVPAARSGPRDDAMRKARVCYDHLAGELGVRLHASLQQRGMLSVGAAGMALSANGLAHLTKLGIDLDALQSSRRPMCRACLDWSVRRYHLAGAVGSALLDRFMQLGWAHRAAKSRVVVFSRAGERAFQRAFPID
jgi:hypothetical protein